MKKILFIFLAILSFSMFSGCQNKQSIDAEKLKYDTLNQEKRLGIIQSLGGARNSNQATHLLRQESGKTIYLKSDILDLNNEKYSKKDVEVSGNLIRTTDGNQLMEVKSIDLIEKDLSPDEVIPQWKNYNSAALGIKFKYRDDFTLQEKNDIIILTSATNKDNSNGEALNEIQKATLAEAEEFSKTITFKLLSDQPDYDLLGSLGLASDSTSDLLSKGLNKSKITLRALDAIKEADKTGTKINYYLKVDSKTYLIKLDIKKSDNIPQEQNIFYDILASVEFI